MGGPGNTEGAGQMLELEEMTEEELVSEDRLSRDHEGDWEGDGEIEGEGLEACVAPSVAGRGVQKRNKPVKGSALGFLLDVEFSTASLRPAAMRPDPYESPSPSSPLMVTTLSSHSVRELFSITTFKSSFSSPPPAAALRSARSRSNCNLWTETCLACLESSYVARSRKWVKDAPWSMKKYSLIVLRGSAQPVRRRKDLLESRDQILVVPQQVE